MDPVVFKALNFLAGRWALGDEVIIFFAKFLPVILVLAALIFVFLQKSKKKAILIFSAAALCLILSRGIIAEAIQFLYHRQRPFEIFNFTPLVNESTSSFPSGHASFLFALSSVLFYFNPKFGLWIFILSALNGLARIAAGVHWPSDVIAGAIVGILSFLIIKLVLNRQFLSLKNISKENA